MIENDQEYPVNEFFLRKIIREELEDFTEGLFITPIPLIQDYRGGLIQWFACFLPEVFDDRLTGEIAQVVNDVIERKNLDSYEKYTIMSLQTVMFLLTLDMKWVKPLLFNICHYDSSLRYAIYEYLFLAMPRISFDDKLLVTGTYRNFRKNHLATELNLFLFVISEGEPLEKINFFKESSSLLKEDCAYYEEWDEIANGKSIRNPFYLSLIKPLRPYISGRLWGTYRYLLKESRKEKNSDKQEELQLTLTFNPEDDLREFLENDPKLQRKYMERIEKHQGLRYTVDLI